MQNDAGTGCEKEIPTYTIQYYSDGGTPITPETFTGEQEIKITTSKPTKEYYVFQQRQLS